MTIKTKEPRVPTDLPLVRLYLDDVAEIVQIFTSALPVKQDSTGGVLPIVTRFDVGRKECDEFEELPKVAKKTNEFGISVRCDEPGAHYATSLHVDRSLVYWTSYGLGKEREWELSRKLQSLFGERRLLTMSPFVLLVAVGLWILGFILTSTPKLVGFGVGVLIVAAVLYVVYPVFTRRPATVVFRYRADQTAIQDERKEKLIPIFATAILSILGTLVVQYLIHRIWPK